MSRKNKYVPWGRTLTTNDKYLGKQKTHSEKVRPVVVIDNNENNELAVVPLSSRNGNNRTRLKNYQQRQSYYKHFVEIEDDEGKPIIVNDKFRENHKNMDVSRRDVEEMRKTVFEKSKQKQRNKKLYNRFHRNK